mgnify:CR=1 FL=1
MKVVLLGYMGVGKSTLGRLLADHLDVKFIDLDSYIEEKEGQSISNLFENKGEIYFRQQETLALNQLLTTPEGMILSLGGGTPVYGDNMQIITETEDVTSIYLKLQTDALVSKLFEQRGDRPIISHINDRIEFEEFVRKHLFERQQFYYMADHILDVTDRSASDSLDDLIKLLNKNT